MPIQKFRRALWLAALPIFAAAPAVQAQTHTNVRPRPSAQVLRGTASFRERIALLPGATLHILVVKDLPGEFGIPVGSAIIPARNGNTPFAVTIPPGSASASGPFRVRAWIVANGEVFMRSLASNTTVEKLDQPLHILLGRVGSNGQTGTGGIVAPAVQKVISGKVEKLDRRGLSPDAVVKVELRELSGSGAVLQIVATQEIPLQGKQLPAEYRIEVPASLLHPGKSFDVAASVTEGGQVRYYTARSYPVDTGVILQNLDVLVSPAKQ